MSEWKRGGGSGTTAASDDQPTVTSIASELAKTAPRISNSNSSGGGNVSRGRRGGGDSMNLFVSAGSSGDKTAWKQPLQDLAPMVTQELSQATVHCVHEQVFGPMTRGSVAAAAGQAEAN